MLQICEMTSLFFEKVALTKPRLWDFRVF